MSKNRSIGLALSGGGVRAMAFHLGLLKFLADNNEFQNIKYISSVSGGTLIIGLIYGLNKNKWPSQERFLEQIYPKITHFLSKRPLLELKDIPYFILNLHLILFNRRCLLAKQIKRKWQIDSLFSEIDEKICWDVCCTTKETGNRFRMKKEHMGDHSIGRTHLNDLTLQDVMSISASVPFFIGNKKLRISDYLWTDYDKKYGKNNLPPSFKKITLLDGGVYDNLGLESLYDIASGKIKQETGVDFVIVSDASKPLGLKSFFRLSDIMMANINKLRQRNFMNFVTNKKRGIFVKLGSNIREHIEKAKSSNFNVPSMVNKNHLSDSELKIVKDYATSLFRIPENKLHLLIKHGYDLCEVYLNMVD